MLQKKIYGQRHPQKQGQRHPRQISGHQEVGGIDGAVCGVVQIVVGLGVRPGRKDRQHRGTFCRCEGLHGEGIEKAEAGEGAPQMLEEVHVLHHSRWAGAAGRGGGGGQWQRVMLYL